MFYLFLNIETSEISLDLLNLYGLESMLSLSVYELGSMFSFPVILASETRTQGLFDTIYFAARVAHL